MFRWRNALTFTLFLGFVQSAGIFAVDMFQGTWTDKDQAYSYSLLAGHEFKYECQSCDYSRPAPNRSVKTEGAWNSAEGACWAGDPKTDKKVALGNLLLYADDVQCCMLAQLLGNKLVLTEVWTKGSGTMASICSNRVLTRQKVVPQAK